MCAGTFEPGNVTGWGSERVNVTNSMESFEMKWQGMSEHLQTTITEMCLRRTKVQRHNRGIPIILSS